VSIWVLRGLRDGVVTTRWPRRPDEYAGSWRGPAAVRPDAPGAGEAGAELERLCPTGAIEATGRPGAGKLRVDQGRCILCGRCVAARPDLFTWSAGATGPAAAAVARQAMVVPDEPETDEAVAGGRVGVP
jgi:ferredoxin